MSLEFIRRVDIELHSFCNRTCEWCPNKTYLRNKQVRMEDWVFNKIIDELVKFKFGKDRLFVNPPVSILKEERSFSRLITENQPIVSFLGYMEPMADMNNFREKVRIAHEKLPPHVELLSNTNGDYISRKNLENLFLTTLNIMDYDCKGREYWTEKLTEAGCLVVKDTSICLFALHKTLGNIRVSLDWPKHHSLENRAGALSKNDKEFIETSVVWKNNLEKRIVPCPEPTYYMNITYNGNVMPCCHIRDDIPIHEDYILGNVKENTLEEIYNSEKAVKFRNRLTVENGDYPTPCKNCQKIRHNSCSGAPNGFNYIGSRYSGNKINNNIVLKNVKTN